MVATAFWFALGIGIGVALACLCRSAKVAYLKGQVEAKKDAWCKGCDVYKRLSACNDKLANRESYVKTLEARCISLRQSNGQLGAEVQRKAWRVIA